MHIVIIGAGNIGRSLTQHCVQKNINVILIDQSSELLDHAKEDIFQSIQYGNLFSKTKYNAFELMKKIDFSYDLGKISSTNYVIENITESLIQKEILYRKINNMEISTKIIASNTSCIPIGQIASWVDFPDRIIGVHFMNPVPQIDTVEVVVSQYTSREIIRKTEEMLSILDKKAIFVKDFPGFISNRISHLMINEAAHILRLQQAKPEQIDAIFKHCYGHKMGPLETADLIGIDTVEKTLNLLYSYYNEDKFKCSPLISKMVLEGHFGKKTGKGFYYY